MLSDFALIGMLMVFASYSAGLVLLGYLLGERNR